jgi:uncharacterized membrane protein YecN with MAPEG domain
MYPQFVLPALVSLLALLQLSAFGMVCGAKRSVYKVKAPATTGNPIWERYYRVHMNTLENIPVFLGGLWAFSLEVSGPIGFALGLLWIVGRLIYFWGYTTAAENRGSGFGISLLAQVILLVGGLYGVGKYLL